MRRFKSILCVVKTKENNELVVKQALELAKNHQADIKFVEVFDVITPNTKLLEKVLGTQNIIANRKSRRKQELFEGIQSLTGDSNINIEIFVGIPFLQIIYEVLRNKHDLVIKLADNGGLRDRLFGSDDMHLLRKCPSAVMLLAPGAPTSKKNILAAVDVADSYPDDEIMCRQQLNTEIIEAATSLAFSEFSELHFLNVCDVFDKDIVKSDLLINNKNLADDYRKEVEKLHKSNLDKVVKNALSFLDEGAVQYLNSEQHFVNGVPREIIPQFANSNNTDLLVLGTVARTGIPGLFMGNTAENILNRLRCSVLAIKPPGFETPVEPVD